MRLLYLKDVQDNLDATKSYTKGVRRINLDFTDGWETLEVHKETNIEEYPEVTDRNTFKRKGYESDHKLSSEFK